MLTLSQSTLDALKRVVEKKKTYRVVYMHADHFEPWRGGVSRRNADDLVTFAELAAKSDFSRKLSLFYKPDIDYYFTEESGPYDRVEGEPVVFTRRSAANQQMASEAVAELLRRGDHEFQVHIHHEGFTRTTGSYYPQVADWLKAHSDASRDARRFELYLTLALNIIREDTGLPLKRWAFVHGNWSLNASDHSICRITNEMSILKRNGCFGDFTFPAGRMHVNPRIEHPFTCIPLDADRAYDLRRAARKPVLPESGAFSPERFFIWSSVIKHEHCSIDYYSPNVMAKLINTGDMVLRWMRDSVHFGGTVYIKTHSHSMVRQYWESPTPVIPSLHPTVQNIYAQLADACAKLNIALEFGTAASIYDELVQASTARSRSGSFFRRFRAAS